MPDTNPFAFKSLSPSSAQSNQKPILILAAVLGVGFLFVLACIVGVGIFIMARGSEGDAKGLPAIVEGEQVKNVAQVKEPVKPVIKVVAAQTPNQPPKKDLLAKALPPQTKPLAPPPANLKPIEQKPDLRWLQEARLDLLDALREKERRMNADAERIGSLSKFDLFRATNALKFVKRFCTNEDPSKIQILQRGTLNEASMIAPRTIRAFQREALMRESIYQQMVQRGEAPARLPWQERRRRYQEFAGITGDREPWDLAAPFDDLNAREMNVLQEGLMVLTKTGFPSMTGEQRRLLLAAGAVSFFEKQIAAFK